MRFSEKDRKDPKEEFEETRFPQSHMASVIGVAIPLISQYLSGLREPPDDVIRRMYAVFQMIRTEHMRTGGFKLSKENLKMLRRRLDEMERSIVRRPGRKEPDADEEGRKCRVN
jgi:transcriptional regulator with XRE-family HTH domain